MLNTGDIPSLLKKGLIIPQHKGGKRSLPANYRPIALTSDLIKIFEKIIKRLWLPSWMRIICSVTHSMVSGLVDLAKANYSTTYHHGVSGTCDLLGLQQGFCPMETQQYRNIRKNACLFVIVPESKNTICMCQRVHVEVTSSSFRSPQGSVLGPLVFLIMISDIDENLLNLLASSFADDTRMLKRIIHMVDISLLQEDFNRVYQWSAKSNSELNDDKFECMRYGPNLDKEGTSYLTPHGTSIENKDGEKDLGVVMPSDCSFAMHIDAVVASTKSTISWILWTFQTREHLPMLTLWKTLVLPIEYCSVLLESYKS